MKNFNVVNYHVTNHCNYDCVYCFGKFKNQRDPSLEEAKTIIDKIAVYFKENQIADGRINFAGGEPTLYTHLDELIEYASSLGIDVSIVTNGSCLTAERIRKWKGKVACIGISIDSINHKTNCDIGRCCQDVDVAVEYQRWIALSKIIHECNIRLKINTVVSRLNLQEDLSPLYRALKPDKIKFFQMHLIDGINDKAKEYDITIEEFEDFCNHHREFQSILFAEPCGSMENSYLMINPSGEFQLNNNGRYQTFGDLKTAPLSQILRNVPMDGEKFVARYVGGGAE